MRTIKPFPNQTKPYFSSDWKIMLDLQMLFSAFDKEHGEPNPTPIQRKDHKLSLVGSLGFFWAGPDAGQQLRRVERPDSQSFHIQLPSKA